MALDDAVTLPPGRHGLTRETVVKSQRDRLLKAMADAVAEKGYAGIAVADVLKRARVSRQTFYEMFSSKEECFLATFDRAAEILLGRLAETATEAGARVDEPAGGDGFERVVATYLDAIASEPAYARIFLVESQSVGKEAVRRRAAIQLRFTDALATLLAAEAPHERFACEVLVAAVGAMVSTRLALGQHETLHELREPIVDLVRRAQAAR